MRAARADSRSGAALAAGWFALVLTAALPAAAVGETIFEDNFDVDPYSNGWTGVGRYWDAAEDACGTTWGYAYRDGDGSFNSPALSIEGYKNLKLIFWHKNDTGGGFKAEAREGGEWYERAYVTTPNSWTRNEVDIGAAGTVTQIRFTYDGCGAECTQRVDCVSIIGEPGGYPNPNDDTYTEQASPDTNHNDDGVLVQDSARYDGWMEFTLGAAEVSSATLYVYQTASGVGSQQVHFYGGVYDFDEDSLTWNNQPDTSGWTDLGSETMNAGPQWYAMDVTSFYNDNLSATVTVNLHSDGSGGSGPWFEDVETSKTGNTAYKPYITTVPLSGETTIWEEPFDTDPFSSNRWLVYYDDCSSSASGTVKYYTGLQDACGVVWGYTYREYSGDRCIVYDGDPFTTEGYIDLKLNFWYKNDGGSITVQVYQDGAWTDDLTEVGAAGSWTEAQLDLSGTVTNIRFQFKASTNTTRRLDCISITGRPCTAPSVTAHPEDANRYLNETANFSVTAEGTDLTYQWEVDTDDDGTFEEIEGATTCSYTTGALTSAEDGNEYRCVVTNGCGEETSNAATLRVFYISVSDLGYLNGADVPMVGMAINSSGVVVGFEEDSGDYSKEAWKWESSVVTSLGTLGGSQSAACDINSAGTVVGWSHTADDANRRAFRWTSGGGMTEVGTISARPDSEACAINSSNEIVGTGFNIVSSSVIRDYRAFIYLPSEAYGLPAGMNSLGTLGGYNSVARAINDSGQVAGGAQNVGGYIRPFRWQNGEMSDLGTLGGDNDKIIHRAEGINNLGEVVGLSYTAGGEAHAFLWLPAENYGLAAGMNDLGTLGGNYSCAFAINDDGVVVGESKNGGGQYRAFRWRNGTMKEMDNLHETSWSMISARGINSDGNIVGFGANPSSQYRAFTGEPNGGGLSPPPLLMGGGFGGGAPESEPQSEFESGFESGTTDAGGEFAGSVCGQGGETLGEVAVSGANPGESFELSITEGGLSSESTARRFRAAALVTFANNVVLERVLTIKTSAAPGSYKAVVGMNFTAAELSGSGVDATNLELQRYDSATGRWVSAGRCLGEIGPTGVVGDSGSVVNSDGTKKFWAVCDDVSAFGVGLQAQSEEPEPEPEPQEISSEPGPEEVNPEPDLEDIESPAEPEAVAGEGDLDGAPGCGVGVVESALASFVGLTLIQGRRRRH